MKIGNRVAYSRTFLKNTGRHLGWAPQARGTVIRVERLGGNKLLTIKWDDGTIARVIEPNIVLVDKLHLEQP